MALKQLVRSPWSMLPLLLVLGLFGVFMYRYIPVDLSFVLGLCLAPFIIRPVQGRAHGSYFIVAMLFFLALLFYRSSTLFYFAFGLGFLYLLETQLGRLNHLALGLLLLLSPMFKYIAFTWSFPIRMQMTIVAAKILRQLGLEAEAKGNMIYLGDLPFSVDPACMGLRMLILSMLMALMLMAYYERKEQRTVSFWAMSFGLAISLVLAVLANFSRLLAVVLFNVLPGQWLHDGIGLISLLVYVVLPLYALSQWYKGGRPDGVISIEPAQKQVKRYWLPLAMMVLMLLVTGPQFWQRRIYQDEALSNFQLEGYRASLTDIGVLQLTSEEALIYIKPPVGWLNSTHDPRICWQGSGYTFGAIKKESIAGIDLYTSTLTKGEDQLYAAWWYDNGDIQTIKEWQWRWKSIGAERGFRLINVNANHPDMLSKEIAYLLQHHQF
ncbi:MAG: exosortase N [Bacteroidota bacterium]